MSHRFILFISILLWGASTLPKAAQADTVLTRAEIKSLRNLVQLMPQSQAARPAKVADGIVPGDALSTGREALAELRFNDGSLARIGEQALFRFSAQNRNLKLSNGTALLLIPPGRGTTEVWTPNATAAIRGSALFIRHIANSKTTVVGALTNSQIEVVDQKNYQRQVLKAGQLAVVVKGKITALYNFDLKTFYESSDLVSGLNLNKKNVTAADVAIAQVQAETSAAVAAQSSLTGEEIIVNPSFVRSSDSPSPPLQQDSNNLRINTSDSTTDLIDNGTVILDRWEILPGNSESASDNDLIPIGDRDGSTKDKNRHPDRDNNGIGDGNGGGRDRHPDKDNNGIGDGDGGGRNNNPDKNDKSRK
ncbi:FecR domain-containing protein [Chroococcidiopsis sp. FACHB-1243]|uniref:FecR family protein n=1 Tax=Chroococcidiopsis sp. [FACHB-1243] TaxID=2692781 RepID=UPI00177C8BE5|nr:FecR family protein [Chroococcidiopsis sp. [FACHB-1243]]MBD2308605.1 FecR domain-containing protein [Chroococcidiopsis sp. [FACHB-1243]]